MEKARYTQSEMMPKRHISRVYIQECVRVHKYRRVAQKYDNYDTTTNACTTASLGGLWLH